MWTGGGVQTGTGRVPDGPHTRQVSLLIDHRPPPGLVELAGPI